MDKKYLGRQIQRYRDEMNIGQETFAEMIGMSQVHVSFIERGTRTPSLKTIIKISSVLGIPIDVLIRGEFDKDQSVKSRVIYDMIETFDNETKDRVLEMIEALVRIEEKHAKK